MKKHFLAGALAVAAIGVAATTLTAADGEKAKNTGPWDLAALKRAPKITWLDEKQNPSPLFYEGEPFQGKPTRVFAYLARPQKAGKVVPAMVLVHGGGGTAFKEWAVLWAKRGYVAPAIDLAGHGPKGERLADGSPDQHDRERFEAGNVKDFWTYHAVANVIRGVSLLANLPEVASDSIGITGISWGGYLACIVAGLDDRLKVAVPVYGCGFIHENSVWVPIFNKMTKERREQWVENFEPSRYVGQARMPVLFVNGTNDFAYPLDSYQKTYRLVKDRSLCVTVNMPHGHPQGWAPVEIGLFVAEKLRDAEPMPRVKKVKRVGKQVAVDFTADAPITKSAVHFTTDGGAWQKRKWQSRPAKIEEGTVHVELPEARPLVYFVTLTDERNATVSTEHETVLK